MLALAARHRNVRTERKQSVIPHVYMFADVVASVHLVMHPRAMSTYLSASRGIILVRRVFPRHAPTVLCLLCFNSSLDADPAPFGMNPLVWMQMARKPNFVSKHRFHRLRIKPVTYLLPLAPESHAGALQYLFHAIMSRHVLAR